MRMTQIALEQAENLLLRAWNRAAADGALKGSLPFMPSVVFSPDASHGDLTSAFCLSASGAAGMDARALAELLFHHAGDMGPYLSSVSVGGPGYLNFRLSDSWYEDALRSAAEAAMRRRRPDSQDLSPLPDPGENWSASLRRRIIAHVLDNVLERAGSRFVCIGVDDHYVNHEDPVPGSTRLLVNGLDPVGDVPPPVLPLDALRFLLCVRLDRPVTVDLDRASRKDRANPYYRVRYTRDRICRILQRCAGSGHSVPLPSEADLSGGWDDETRALIRSLCRWDDLTREAARTADPGLIPEYLLSLADRFWKQRKALLPTETGAWSEPARMLLCDTVRLTLEDGLGLLGIAI